MKPRRLYRRLINLPAWGLYRNGELVATIRAESAEVARKLFEAFEEWRPGDHIKRV